MYIYVRTFIQRLSDTHSKWVDGKYAGSSVEPQQHVVLIGNEMNQALCNNKEVWHMELPEEAHMLNTCTWSFPAEAPSAKPFVGSLGSVAHPPNPQSLDPDVQAKARLLKEWRESETTWVSYEDSRAARRCSSRGVRVASSTGSIDIFESTISATRARFEEARASTSSKTSCGAVCTCL